MSWLAFVCLLLLGLVADRLSAQAERGQDPTAARIATARAAIDRGDPGRAIELIEPLGQTADALALRGTARIMLGEVKAGAGDLERALELDPNQGMALSNLAGLEIAEGDFRGALPLLERARAAAPAEAGGYLNLGAVQGMLGERVEAQASFERYLQLEGGSPEAHYLVASNFALIGAEHLALEQLEKAIAGDERLRMRARRDDRFVKLDSLEYRVLLSTDPVAIPAGYHQAAAAFRSRYSPRDSGILFSVLEALSEVGVAYDPEVESTARWALIWAERGLRLKLYNQDNGTGVISASAPPGSFTPAEWKQTTDALFRRVHELAPDGS